MAGILSPDGGLRTVVTQRWRMKFHLARGERLFVVPGLLVDEPVPFNSPLMHHCIRMAHVTVVRALAPENPCGECRECCITPYIAQGNDWHRPSKPSHVACEYCDHEVGCLVHYNRPDNPCRKFRCRWLISQDRNWRMGPELRPDRCGVMMTGPEKARGEPENLVWIHPSTRAPGAVDRDPVRGYVARIQSEGEVARLVTSYHGER